MISAVGTSSRNVILDDPQPHTLEEFKKENEELKKKVQELLEVERRLNTENLKLRGELADVQCKLLIQQQPPHISQFDKKDEKLLSSTHASTTQSFTPISASNYIETSSSLESTPPSPLKTSSLNDGKDNKCGKDEKCRSGSESSIANENSKNEIAKEVQKENGSENENNKKENGKTRDHELERKKETAVKRKEKENEKENEKEKKISEEEEEELQRANLDYTEDSPFYRRKLYEHEQRIFDFDERLEVLIKLTQDFVHEANKFAQVSTILSQELFRKWTKIEISWRSDGFCTLGASMTRLGEMVESFSTVLTNLGRALDMLLIQAMIEFRRKQIKSARDSAKLLEKITDEYESTLAKYLSSKDKTRKPEEEQALAEIRSKFELQRFDHVKLLNEVRKQKRFDLIEIVCASQYAFVTFFHEGGYTAETVKQDLTSIRLQVNEKRVGLKKEAKIISQNRVKLESKLHTTNGTVFRVANEFPSPEQLRRKSLGQIDKQGYLRKQSSSIARDWKRRWFAIEDGQLFYFRSHKDLSPKYVVNILICNVRPSLKHELRFVFEIVSPQQRRYLLQTEDDEDLKEWIDVLQRETKALLSQQVPQKDRKKPNDKELVKKMEMKTNAVNKLRQTNKTCVDCNAKDPEWVSINIGCMMCIVCSGIHRSLGVQTSKIRSVELDTMDPALLSVLAAVGNQTVNKIYEHSLPDEAEKPNSTSSRDKKEAFIRNKYEKKAYINKALLQRSTQAQRNKDIHDAAAADDIEAMVSLLALGVDVNWQNPADNLRTALHKAAENDSIHAAELLIQNGAKTNVIDKEGKGPLQVAMECGKLRMKERLDHKKNRTPVKDDRSD